MGSTASTNYPKLQAISQKERVKEIVRFIMPLYYSKEALNPPEKEIVEKSWKMIINNQCQHFKEIKISENLENESALDYFFDVFYNRFFDVHPGSKTLFHRSIHKQGSFFGRYISLLIAELEEPDKLKASLENLANLHNKIGVKAFEYAVMGEVFLFALRKVLGNDVYNATCHSGWVKVFSRILDGIIPVVVEYELTSAGAADEILTKRLHNEGMKGPLFTEKSTTRAPAPV